MAIMTIEQKTQRHRIESLRHNSRT